MLCTLVLHLSQGKPSALHLSQGTSIYLSVIIIFLSYFILFNFQLSTYGGNYEIHDYKFIIRGNRKEKNHCWLSSLLVWCCVLLLTPRLELGGLVRAGPFSSGSAEALASVARFSLLGLLVLVLVVPLPFSLTAFTRLVV